MAVNKDFFKYNPETDGDMTFNIDKALNENWDLVNEGLNDLIPTLVSTTLKSAKWVDGVYDMSEDYPSESYNITMSYDGDNYTSDSKEAFDGAGIVGSLAANKFIATGDVPSVDIPVILEVSAV